VNQLTGYLPPESPPGGSYQTSPLLIITAYFSASLSSLSLTDKFIKERSKIKQDNPDKVKTAIAQLL
jgi:hypothetical protein